MKFAMQLLCVLAAIGMLSSLVLAADAAPGGKDKAKADPAKTTSVSGKILSVQGGKIMFSAKAGTGGGSTSVTVMTNEKTSVSIDGKVSRVGDLKPNMNATATVDNNTKVATSIMVTAEKKK